MAKRPRIDEVEIGDRIFYRIKNESSACQIIGTILIEMRRAAPLVPLLKKPGMMLALHAIERLHERQCVSIIEHPEMPDPPPPFEP